MQQLFRKKNKSSAPPPTYWNYVWQQFSKNKRALFSLYLVGFLVFIALSADFLANNKPIVLHYNGKWYSPVLRAYTVEFFGGKWQPELLNASWKNLPADFAIWPPIPYKYNDIDPTSNFLPPLSTSQKHWLGTDNLGRDVAASMVYGTRIALSVGIVSMGISSLIGIFLGGIAGFFGDDRFKISRIRLILNLLFFPFAFFYAFTVRSYHLTDAFSTNPLALLIALLGSFFLFFAILGIANLIALPLKRLAWCRQKINLPLDLLVTRFIEIVVSIPVLILILAIVAIAQPSIYNVMAIIGLVSWTGIARFVRAELLKIRALEYIEATQALGYSNFRTVLRHALPNALSPVFITLAFGIASAILVESFLSFLNVGVPLETMTWGKLLALSRSNATAWWLAVFPGLAIFFTVTFFNLIGEGLTDALDPRLRQ